MIKKPPPRPSKNRDLVNAGIKAAASDRRPFNLSISKCLLADFTAICIKTDTNVSEAITALIEREVMAWNARKIKASKAIKRR